MEISIISQFYVALMSAILGAFLGVLYDVIRILRTFLGIAYVNKFTEKLRQVRLPLIKNPFLKEKKKSKISEKVILFVTDILYFLFVSLIMVIYVYYINSGIVRWYIFVCALLGMLLYYFTLGKLVISVSEYIVFSLKVCFSYILFFPSRPIIALYRKIKKLFLKLKEGRKIKRKEKTKKQGTRQELIKIGRGEV